MKLLNELFNIQSNQKILSLSSDSRQPNDDGIFFCLNGMTNDAHVYIDEAIKNGAKVIVHSDEIKKVDGITYIKVENTIKELNRVANIFYDNPYDDLTVYAVTGTNGKTTISYIIENLLSHFEKCAYNGTIGTKIDGKLTQTSHFTTPDTITLTNIVAQARDNGCTSLALEVSSHALEQHRCDNLKADVAIFTNLTHEHLDYHKTMDAYMSAKRRLFEMLDKDKTALLNMDDPAYADIRRACHSNIVTYGSDNEADYQLFAVKLYPTHTEFSLKTPTTTHRIKTNLLSHINTYNLTAALAALEITGHNIEDLLQFTMSLDTNIGRFQKIPHDKLNIYIDFAHTPDGFIKMFEFAKATTFPTNDIIAVFGSAGRRDITKRPILGKFADKYCDKIIICEDDYRDEDPLRIANQILEGIENKDKVKIIIDRYQAIESAILNASDDDTIVILSKGLDRYIPKNGKDEYWMGDDQAVLEILAKNNI